MIIIKNKLLRSKQFSRYNGIRVSQGIMVSMRWLKKALESDNG